MTQINTYTEYDEKTFFFRKMIPIYVIIPKLPFFLSCSPLLFVYIYILCVYRAEALSVSGTQHLETHTLHIKHKSIPSFI